MSDKDEDKIVMLLRVLRAHGVKHAKFVGAAVVELEFFADTSGVESSGAVTEPAPDADGTEDYEKALEQIRGRRFRKGAES